ncbi:MAG: 3-oxoacyl-[acyl-carrier-protein] reductase [Nitrospira sp.]|nr:3-oxoacyl-[acyl-carrier-protein] reductase [Nitrospira sp.]MCB9710018.1 3-oxoacyl-[acyl-carrier-protein] reductase [Nitrospiraceae bacterium]MDR4487240.1 3-oxoacyl-[acyl-carrier-protein] reductase [Nitrospirales bacterium]MCA9464375.1 3-oxoacyl-[acyl-carrier-protein] reductase [Nitrospira sp.]MCA9479484.1 3-oxoacyl-[acyl-carrier-protein] reductase [Nitrospira sp.]
MSLMGKIAVVTGAARGIGQAVATMLARDGADVVVADIEASRCEETVNLIRQAGRKAMALGVNVGEWEQVKGMVDQIVQEWGRVDILVNNAGITRDGLLMRMKEEDWQAVLQVNLTGTFFCSKAVLPTMSKQRSGRIVNIASIVGAIGNVGQANYAASKAAVIGLTKTVAREYAGRNVTVNAVAPGFIDTAMTQQLSPEIKEALLNQIPCKRLGQASDVAEAVCFLSSDKAGYITGHVLHVNGGMHMA